MAEKKEKNQAIELLKKIGGYVLKFGIAGALIYWLISSNPEILAKIGSITFTSDTIMLVLAGVGAVLVGQLMLAYRLIMLVNALGLKVPLIKCFGLNLIGMLSGSVLPGLVSGDAVKAVYLFSDAKDKKGKAIATVLVDRLFGLYGMFLLATIGLGLAYLTNNLPFEHPILLIAPLLVLGGAIGMGLLMVRKFRRMRLIHNIWRKLPRKIKEFIGGVVFCFQSPKRVLLAILISVANHATVVVTFILAAAILKIDIPVLTQFVLNPLAMFMNVLPLTPGGVGLTEGVFGYLYSFMGVTEGGAIGLVGRFIQYIPYIIGGGIFMMVLKVKLKPDPEPEENKEIVK